MEDKQKIKIHTQSAPRNSYREEKERRFGLEKQSRIILAMGITLCIILPVAIILPNGVVTANNTHLSLAWYFNQAGENAGQLLQWLGGNQDAETIRFIVFRYMIVALTGAALAISGAVYQGAFRNALASPTTLGVQSGGVMGGTIYIMCFSGLQETGITTYSEVHAAVAEMNVFEKYGQSFAVLAGCFFGVVFIVGVSRIVGRGKVSTISLVLCGTVFGSVISSGIGLVEYYMLMENTFDPRTYMLRYLMMGSFSGTYTLQQLVIMGIPILIGIAVIILMRNKLNLLVFGEDEARSMGVSVTWIQNITVAIVTVLTAIVISFCGMIGFMGFIIPHMVRKLIGPDFRYLLPGSAIMGAICMVIIYHVAEMVECSDNINMMTSLLGGIGFLIMLIRFRSKGNADWA